MDAVESDPDRSDDDSGAPARAMPDGRRSRVRWSPRFLLLLAVVALFVLGPIVVMVPMSFRVGRMGQEVVWGFDTWTSMLTDGSFWRVLKDTTVLAVTRQVIGIVIGVWVAWLIARTDLPGRKYFEYGCWVAVFLPSLTVTLGWIMVLDPANGLANRAVELLPFVDKGPFDIYSFWGITWVQLLASVIPLKVILLAPAIRNISASLEEASYASGATSFTTLRRIVIPLLMPTILVALVLGVIRSMESFEVELVLGTPAGIDVLATRIYRLGAQFPPDFSAATAIGIISLLLLVPAVIVQYRYSNKRSFATVTGHFKSNVLPLGRSKWAAFVGVLVLVLMMTVFPLVFVVLGTFMKLFGRFDAKDPWTTQHWTQILQSRAFTDALENTLVLATATAFGALVVCSVFAYIIVRTKTRGRSALDFMVWLPSMLPGMVIGLGYLTLFLIVPFFSGLLYGTVGALIVVLILSNATLTTQMIKTSFAQLGNELEEASRSSGAVWIYTFRRVVLPLIGPTLAVVVILAFSSAARATGPVALLATSDTAPLSILQLNQMADNNLARASVVGVFLVLLTAGVAVVANVIGNRVRGRGMRS
ncbi:ABC transporter permease [Rhizomonospora bruguierae]|uniref:ABC transporter permease n=1 Tax=Rhizomonospora bruguierae TaxID=1581705 RepID=UPI001BD0B6C6|nr:iron ABC transporter permease [Micromonospora sp. NBRC 107566]